MAQGGVTAPPLFVRGSGGLSCGMCSSEDKKGGRCQDKGGSQKAEACRREKEEKMVWVPLITPAEDATLLEGTEGSQVTGSKCKEVTSRYEEG